MFRNETLRLSVAAITLTTFFNLTLSPRTAVAQPRTAPTQVGRPLALPPKPSPAPTLSPEDRFAALLHSLHEDVKAAAPRTAASRGTRTGGAQALAPLSGASLAATVSSIRARGSELEKLYADIDQSFTLTGQQLKAAGLPKEILDRHASAIAQYEKRRADFTRILGQLDRASNNATELRSTLAALDGFLARFPSATPHQRTDPNQLPFRISDRKVRAPYETRKQFQAHPFPAGRSAKKSATATRAAASPELSETEDVQLTPAVRQRAAALGNNPVNIYNWVRNNIRFVPSYGSIQGSDMTLQSLRGNAFDTASLLIALLRAAGIPSRYVYGTIEVPASEAMNWVGGVTTPSAAQSLLGQGGIPNVGILSGGTIQAFRMEHIWVEAYVDYTPSRGAISRQPQTWVPMDPSFKQYVFTPGMALKLHVPLDPQVLLDEITEGGTVNEAQGYFQNLNHANLQARVASYHQQVQAYVDSQKTAATVGDVLGTQTIVKREAPFLEGSLPYKTLATGSVFTALPDSLRWRFKTNIYAAGGYDGSDSPIIELSQSTAALAGKKLTLSFAPATEADQAVLRSYLPKPHADGSPIAASEYPQSLPGYLLNMKAEFRLDGQLVTQTTQSFTMGSTVRQSSQFFNPSTGSWAGGADNDITVGEYNAIGMDLQGMNGYQLAAHQAKVAATKARLEQFQQNPNDTTPILGLTKEDLTGDVLQGGILAYFGQVDASDTLAARSAGEVTTYRLPSYGRFFTAAEPHYWFGIPRSVGFPGVGLDVDYLFQHAAAKNGDPTVLTNFIRRVGAAGSSAEHTVPEMLFRNPQLPPDASAQPQGVSAVKALALASMQGQKIYTLNQGNRALHATILQSLQISQDVKWEIADALASNKEVTVHERDVNVNGWIGCGYTILDPATGAGAYKIAGGSNGGFLRWVDSNSGLLGLGAWVLGALGVICPICFFIAVIAVIVILAAGIVTFLEDSDGSCGFGALALYVGIELLLTIAGIFAAPLIAWRFWALGFLADGGIRTALTHCNK